MMDAAVNESRKHREEKRFSNVLVRYNVRVNMIDR